MFNNHDLNEVTRERRMMEGNPKIDASQTFLTSLTQNSGRCSVSRNVDAPDRLAFAWQEALSSDERVLEVKTEPEVAPFPRT